MASVAVSIGEHDDSPLWVGIVAFGRVADDLLRHAKGDLISASGRVQRNSWTTQAGEKREQLQIVANSVISSRTVRPSSGGRRQEDNHTTATVPAAQPAQVGRRIKGGRHGR